MHKRLHISRTTARRGLLLAALALLLYGVVPQFGGLHAGWHTLLSANVGLLLMSIVLLALTFLISALSYQLLALHRLLLPTTIAVQIAGGFADKLLPAGLGLIGLNAAYLRKRGHRLPEALAVAATNNAIGFLGYLVALVLAVPILGVRWPSIRIAHGVAYAATAIALAAAVALALFGRRIAHSLRTTFQGLRTYRRHPLRLAGALLLAMLLPCLFTSMVYCCAHALGLLVSPAAAFAAFSASQLVGSVTPTPGGIVGAEAGLIGALVAYGLTVEQAALVALLYRLITYWLPMLPGGAVLLAIRRRYL